MKTRSRRGQGTTTLLAALLAASLASLPSSAVADSHAGKRINPGALTRGPATPLLHVAGRKIIDGDTTVKVSGGPSVTLVGRVGTDYLVLTSDLDHREPYQPGWRLQRVTVDGDQSVVAGGRREPPTAQLSEDKAHIVLARDGHTGSVLRVLETASGDLIAQRTFPFVTVLDYANRRMVIGQWENRSVPPRTFWWNPGRDTTSRIARLAGYLADVSMDRLGLFTGDPYDGGCQKIVRLSKPSDVIWRSCGAVVLALSPTGKRMVTTYILQDGPGPLRIQVRATHGRVLNTYRSEIFGTIHWESDSRLLLQAAGPKAVAMTRCTVDACERISALHKVGHRYPFDVMPIWQFADESLLNS